MHKQLADLGMGEGNTAQFWTQVGRTYGETHMGSPAGTEGFTVVVSNTF